MTTITTYHKLGGLKQRKIIVSQFCRLEVGNQCVSRTMLSLKDLGENLSYAFTLALPAITGIFWFRETSFSSLPPSLHGILSVHLGVHLLLLKRAYWMTVPPHPPANWIHLNFITYTKSYFQIRLYSQVPGVKTSTFLLGLHNSSHQNWFAIVYGSINHGKGCFSGWLWLNVSLE